MPCTKCNGKGHNIRTCSTLPKLDWEKFGTYGLHIHCPSAAMPKDGPSAGVTITTAILSRLCNVAVKNTVAMTGEIDLYGNVRAIGGLNAKLLGAIRAGVKTVLIPHENEQEYKNFLKKMDEDGVDNPLNIILVKTIDEVIRETFVKNSVF